MTTRKSIDVEEPVPAVVYLEFTARRTGQPSFIVDSLVPLAIESVLTGGTMLTFSTGQGELLHISVADTADEVRRIYQDLARTT